MSAGEGPDNGWAAHDCGYAPLLTAGRLVKANDPAWQMREKRNRDYGCLTELVRMRAALRPDHKRYPGYELGFFHSHKSLREYPGYPDFHIWGDLGDLIREAKVMGEAPKPAQVATLTRMRRAGRDVGVWWPCCWYSGRIDRELAAIAGRSPIGQHTAPGLPPQPGQPGYQPWTPPPRDGRPARQPGGRRAPASRPPEDPAGDDVSDLAGNAVGYVVPMGVTSIVDVWLCDNDVRPVLTPYPIRLIITIAGEFAVQVRPGRHRIWRRRPLKAPFPHRAVAELLDRGVARKLGQAAAVVAWLTEHTEQTEAAAAATTRSNP